MGLFIVEFDLIDLKNRQRRSPLTVENGDVIVDKGRPTITVRNVEADSPDDAKNKARPKANAFLDELCLQANTGLAIGNGCTIMLQDSPETRHIRTRTLELTLKGGHRTKIPRVLKEVKIRPSDAKTYYRRAAMSNDTFDKFRNLYLAIENVASKIEVAKGEHFHFGKERLKFALQECFSSNTQLLEEHSHVSGFENTGDIFLGVACFLWENRCKLSHSKATEDKKIPSDPNDEWEVKVSLPLAELVAKSLIAYEDTHLSPLILGK